MGITEYLELVRECVTTVMAALTVVRAAQGLRAAGLSECRVRRPA